MEREQRMNGNVNILKVGGEEKQECWDRRVSPAKEVSAS